MGQSEQCSECGQDIDMQSLKEREAKMCSDCQERNKNISLNPLSQMKLKAVEVFSTSESNFGVMKNGKSK